MSTPTFSQIIALSLQILEKFRIWQQADGWTLRKIGVIHEGLKFQGVSYPGQAYSSVSIYSNDYFGQGGFSLSLHFISPPRAPIEGSLGFSLAKQVRGGKESKTRRVAVGIENGLPTSVTVTKGRAWFQRKYPTWENGAGIDGQIQPDQLEELFRHLTLALKAM